MQLGEDLSLGYAVNHPVFGERPQRAPIPAGAYVSLAAIGTSVSADNLRVLQTRVEDTKTTLESSNTTAIAALGREDLLGDMFYAGTLGYFAQLTSLAQLLGIASRANTQLLPSMGTYGYIPDVSYFFGVPRSIDPGGVVMDLPLINSNIRVHDGDTESNKSAVMQTGVLSSTLEHVIPEQMFTDEDNPGEAISAVKALQKATAAGQRIYQITQSNIDSVLPKIHHDADTMNEIRASVVAGKEVITHTDAA